MALPPEDTSWTWHLKHSFLFRDPWYILKISGLGNRRISFRKKRPEDILRMHLAAPLCTFMYPPPKLTWQWKKKHLKILKMYLTFKNGNVPLPISKKKPPKEWNFVQKINQGPRSSHSTLCSLDEMRQRDLEGTIQSGRSKSISWLLGWYP